MKSQHTNYTLIRAFTLIEMMIAITILGILSVLLFRTFDYVQNIGFYITQKNNTYTALSALQTHTKYISDTYSHISTSGYTDIQAQNLTGDVRILDVYNPNTQATGSLYVSGDCALGCSLFLREKGIDIQLVDSEHYYLNIAIRPIPSIDTLYAQTHQNSTPAEDGTISSATNTRKEVQAHGFWLYGMIYPRTQNSTKKALTGMGLPIQSFVHLGGSH